MSGNGSKRRARARRIVAAPIAVLVVLVGVFAVASPAFADTSVGNAGLCVGQPAPGGCDSGSGGTTHALPGSTVTLGVTFTATNGVPAGKFIAIDSQPSFPDGFQFSSSDSDYTVTNVTQSETCALDADITQYNPNIVFVFMPAGCVANPGDQVIVTLANVVMPDDTVSVPVDVSTYVDEADVQTNAIDVVSPPSPPQSPGVSGGDGSITVSWSTPLSTGGSDITGYDVYCSTGTIDIDGTPTATTDASTFSTELTGLTKGDHYSCVVTAVNAIGQSDPSDTVSAAVEGVPNRPTSVYTLAYSQTIDVRWSHPTGNGGTRITHYLVYCSTTGHATVDPSDLCATVRGALTRATLRHVTTGVPYSITVVAENAIGLSPPSLEVTAVPSRAPSRPRALHVTPVTGGLSLTWKAPLHDFGSPIQTYFAECATQPDFSDEVIVSTDAATLQTEIDGLTSGTPYYCAVNALNDAGQVSRPSLVVTATTP